MTARRTATIAAACIVLAAPTLAGGPTEAERAEFIAAVEAVGCEVTSPQLAAEVEEITGFDEDLLDEIVMKLEDEGLVQVDFEVGGLLLKTEACG
ncbi:MAG: hypothetical protein JJU09_08490 [Rhodobacteraceae bacterium]|nr:hypothetical protein [Paracoccaceae bacterium]TVR44019.1 MAG: hypothetical protein EA386_14925 [Paracoccaceae bacterium]